MPPTVATPTISIRDEKNQPVEKSIADVSPAMVRDAKPYRMFRWYLGQTHYSGSYWSSTESAHVIYESRLELSRLLMADFDRSVTKIVAQPFLLRARVDGKIRRHIPDYWLLTGDGPVVVDVKPAARLHDPVVRATFDWTGAVVESIGWRFEIAGEQPEARLENVRFLAGYRRAEYISRTALDSLRVINLDGLQFRDAVRSVSQPEPLVRAALLHMLWAQEVTADLSEVLCSRTLLHLGVKSFAGPPSKPGRVAASRAKG